MKILFVMVKEDYIDPMNIEILSGLAKRAGHETFLNVLEHNDLFEDIKKIRPNIIAYSAKTGESNVFFKVNLAIKERFGDKIFTIMGGPHPTFNHSRMQLEGEQLSSTLKNIENTRLDCLGIGECDEAWIDLLNAISRKLPIDSIPNIVTANNRMLDGSANIRGRTSCLDDLPFHDRELIYSKTRLKHFGMRSIMANRGCPFVCTYCFNAKFNSLYQGKGKIVNRYSVHRLLDELEDLKANYTTQFIKFYDDIFTYKSDEWLHEFAEQYPKRIGLPFHVLVRADLIRKDPEIIKLLKHAGIQSISMSIESGNPFIRDQIFKRRMSAEDIQFAFDLCHKNKINTFSNTILAVPAPLIPNAFSDGFEEKTSTLVRQLESYFKINLNDLHDRFDLKHSLALTDRQEVVAQLESIGLRKRALDYDIDSIDQNIKAKVVFGEFPELHPYPGTPVTQYTIDVGAFDGDFQKLHQNYQTDSPFNCFTDEEKLQQTNLSLLALPLLIFPRARDFTINHLIQKKWTKLYFGLYFLAKAYLVSTKIYPMKYSWRHIGRNIKESFFSEILKHSRSEGEKFYHRLRGLKTRTPEVLGGPWQS